MEAQAYEKLELKKKSIKINDARYRLKITAEYELLAKVLGASGQGNKQSKLKLLENAKWNILFFQEMLRKMPNSGGKRRGQLAEVQDKFLGMVQNDPFFLDAAILPKDIGTIMDAPKENQILWKNLKRKETPTTAPCKKKRRKYKPCKGRSTRRKALQKEKKSKTKTARRKKEKLNAESIVEKKTGRLRKKIEKETNLVKRKGGRPRKKNHAQPSTMEVQVMGTRMGKARKDELKDISNTHESAEMQQIEVIILPNPENFSEDEENIVFPNDEEGIQFPDKKGILLSDDKKCIPPLNDKKSMDVNCTYSSNLYSLIFNECLEYATSDQEDDDEILEDEEDSPEPSSEHVKGAFSALLEENEIDVQCLDSSFADKFSDLGLMNVQTSEIVCTEEDAPGSPAVEYPQSLDIENIEINPGDIEFLYEVIAQQPPIQDILIEDSSSEDV